MKYLQTLINRHNTKVKVERVVSKIDSGPTINQLQEISLFTYDDIKFKIVIEVLMRRLKKKNNIIITKSLTLILYLLQNGSPDFIFWLQHNYSILFKYITMNKYKLPNNNIIDMKFKKIVQLSTNNQMLKTYRVNIHKYRNDMNSPGIKRTSIDLIKSNEVVVDESKVSTSFDLSRSKYNNIDNTLAEKILMAI